jgi:hypothetical protein
VLLGWLLMLLLLLLQTTGVQLANLLRSASLQSPNT